VRVDFYVLPPGDKNDQLPFTCRLTEKAYDLGQRIYIHTESEAQAIQLDNLLWTFRQGSFIPHALYETDNDGELPAHIGWRGEPSGRDLLINLAPTVPVFHDRFERIAEIVNHDEAAKQAARERFKFYRERGITPESHTIEN
jgi:DNA polymerase-3 subunit chi